jgi:hypothetical protein
MNVFRYTFRELPRINHYILLLLLVVGCTPVPPKVINITKAEDYRPSTPGSIKTVQQAIAAVMTAAADSGLPKIDSLSLWLYENSEAFAYWGRGNAELHEVANEAAFTKADSIHINLGSSAATRWGSGAAVLAHEFGHVIHNSLVRNEIEAPVWFREGFAEWVAAKVMDSLKWRSVDVTTRRAWRELKHNGSFDRSVLLDYKNWKSRLEKPEGFVATYGVAFVAVDRLIGRRGLAAAIEYSKTGEFEKSFGQSFSDFETELEKSVTEKVHSKSEFSVGKPEWQVGFRWKYEVKESNNISERIDEIVGTAPTTHGPAFLLRHGSEETVRSTEDMGVLETRKNGLIVSRFDRSGNLFAWPLVQGKQWTASYNVEDFESKKTKAEQRVRIVAGSELVNVPAGTFETVKLEFYLPRSGRLIGEYWYSPEVRWFVKSVSYESVDAYYREERLASYNLATQDTAPPK